MFLLTITVAQSKVRCSALVAFPRAFLMWLRELFEAFVLATIHRFNPNTQQTHGTVWLGLLNPRTLLGGWYQHPHNWEVSWLLQQNRVVLIYNLSFSLFTIIYHQWEALNQNIIFKNPFDILSKKQVMVRNYGVVFVQSNHIHLL